MNEGVCTASRVVDEKRFLSCSVIVGMGWLRVDA